jgi:beta-glucanase (GH16 family)
MLYKRFASQFRLLTIILFSLVVTGCGDGDGPTPVVDPTPPAAESYTLVWSDEFNVDGPPDVRTWTMETGYGPDNDGWGNKEWQLYTDDTTSANNNVRVENGDLIITARCSGTQAECANGATADKTGIITSARLISQNKLDVKYGNIQARIKTPPGKGMWPAFWMLGTIISDLNWPAAGEIDIMEMHQFFSNDRTTHFTVHFCDETLLPDESDNNNCFGDGGRVFDSRFLEFDLPLTTDYHIFELDWDQERVIGKIDGITYYSRPIDPETEEEFLRSFFLILNVAVGGDLGGPPSPDVDWTRQEMKIDWVRVYKKDIASSGLLEVVPEDPTEPLPFVRTINSAEFGGDSVVTDLASTAVTPLFGDTVVELDYRTANTSFSGAAFNFKNVDLRNFTTFEFSLDRSQFSSLADIGIEISDERNAGGNPVGVVNVPLTKYMPVRSEGNWDTYKIPMADFNGVDLENVNNVGFWNPVDASSPPRLVAGKLYLDGIQFKRDECTTAPTVAFDLDNYNPDTLVDVESSVAAVTVNDVCNASRTAVVKVETDTGDIGVGVNIDATGTGTTRFNLAKPDSVCSTDDRRQIAKLSADSNPMTATYSRTDFLPDGGSQVITVTDVAGIDFGGPGTSLVGDKYYLYATDPGQQLTWFVDVDYILSPFGSDATFDLAASDTTFDPVTALTAGFGYSIWNVQYVFLGGVINSNFDGFAAGKDTLNFKVKDVPNNVIRVGFNGTNPSFLDINLTTSGFATALTDGWYEVRVPLSQWTGFENSDYLLFEGAGPTDQFTFLLTDIFLQDAAGNLPAECIVPPVEESDTIGVYSETNTDPVITYNRIINSVEFGGNPTVSDENSTNVTPFDGSVSLLADFQDDADPGTTFGGAIFDIVGVAPADVSAYVTLKFAINTTGVPTFADLVIQPEDGSAPVDSVFLSDYPAVSISGDWSVHEIPLSAFPNEDFSNLTLLGFWNMSSTTGDPTALTYGPLYLDDIHFSKLPLSIGLYSETKINPVITYSGIINAADFGGNQTIADENSTAVTPFEGSVSLEIDFQDDSNPATSFGGAIFDVGGGDISGYNTLRFAIDTSQMGSFADLVIQPEDGSVPVESVFLSAYPPVSTSGDWSIHEIPLSAFPNLDKSNLTLLGFWNASSSVGSVTLTYGKIYLDDIRFYE